MGYGYFNTLHDVGYTYFVANGKFRKDKYFESKQILPKKLCEELISDHKNFVIKEEKKKKLMGLYIKEVGVELDLNIINNLKKF